jgi:hypothetical protein
LFIVATFIATTRIYRKDPSRIIVSRNQLVLYLSNHIRYELVAKINARF